MASFQRYYQLLLAGNEKRNLTRITGEREVVIKHFLDSLAVLLGVPPSWQSQEIQLLDVGSGAGFPGLPLLLACPSWRGVLLEATRKKVEFLSQAIVELQLNDRVEALWGRSDSAPRSQIGRFDLVCARAVTRLDQLVAWTLPFVKPGGRAVLSKGPQGADEVPGALPAIANEGGMPPRLLRWELPEGAGARSLVVIEKQHDTK
ncbi:MAG: 16S rRNA (guanine(527)-N(7))-methyltransferase RsmG [Cyanobacteria bacterium REEB65]|nr:16S rRNA (guanine(527)-N(7))-methyltransferase RsmG [Cyanobacteria bacterium REEB65]